MRDSCVSFVRHSDAGRRLRAERCSREVEVAMSFEDTLRAIVREELRPVVEEIRRALVSSPSDGELVTYARAAQLVGVSVSTIRARIASGALAKYGKGKAVRVRRADVLAMFERGASPAVPRGDAVEARILEIQSKRKAAH
jgi:excisionase family DNA binding protein